MSKTLWVTKLPDDTDVLVKKGQTISAGELLARKEQKEFKSPTKGTIAEVSDKRIKLEFKSDKISGQGGNDLHAWGELLWQPDLDYSQLNSDYKGKIVAIELKKLSPFLISKARTLGVCGLVVLTDEIEERDWPLPVLAINKKGASLIKKNKGVKSLLDASNDYLLIPK